MIPAPIAKLANLWIEEQQQARFRSLMLTVEPHGHLTDSLFLRVAFKGKEI